MAGPISIGLGLAGRDLTEPRLSPAADRVSIAVRDQGATSIVVIGAGTGTHRGDDRSTRTSVERVVTTGPPPAVGRGLGGGCSAWVDDHHLVYAAVDGHLWWQPLDAAEPLDLTPDLDVEGRIGAQAPSTTETFITFTVDQAEVWILDTATGVRIRLDDGGDDFCFDPSIIARGSELVVCWQAWSVPSMPWDDAVIRLATVDRRLEQVTDRQHVAGTGAIQQPRWAADGSLVTVRDDHGWSNVWIDDRPLLDEACEHAGPTWGPGQRSYALDPDGSPQIVVTRNERGFGRLVGVDRATGAVTELGRGVHGALDRRGDRLVAVRSGARTPTEVVVYDLGALADQRRRTIAVGPAVGWESVDLVEPELLVVEHAGIEHAGIGLHARWYAADTGDSVELPVEERRLVCMIHGGPTDQWPVGFLWRVAVWRSRGWDVLVADPRGSTGHGRDYQQALRGEWGRLDVDDTAAIIAAVQDRGRATPERTLVVGSSSGGLTVLGLLARHGACVAGGVALSPVGDLADLAERSHRFEAHYALGLVGDPIADRMRYVERSPVSTAAAIERPVLVMHGDADPVVPVEHSRRVVDTLRAADREVEYHEFAGEGHGFRSAAARRAEIEISLAFGERLCPLH